MWILWKCRCQANRVISLCSVPSILYIFQNWGKEIKMRGGRGKWEAGGGGDGDRVRQGERGP